MRRRRALAAGAAALSLVLLAPAGARGGAWRGLDDAVMERVAREHRHPPRPLVDLGGGDLEHLAFLLAGLLGGVAACHAWRALGRGRDATPPPGRPPGT